MSEWTRGTESGMLHKKALLTESSESDMMEEALEPPFLEFLNDLPVHSGSRPSLARGTGYMALELLFWPSHYSFL